MTMGEADLVSCAAKNAALTKDQAQKALEAVLAGMKETLERGEEVRLIGFGTFCCPTDKSKRWL